MTTEMFRHFLDRVFSRDQNTVELYFPQRLHRLDRILSGEFIIYNRKYKE